MSTTIHSATCVAVGGRGVLIEGAPGSGKSSLALALIDRGATLVSDDAVALDARDLRLFASPAPNIAGLLEIRNLGLVRFTVTERAPVALVLCLDPAAPRYIEAAEKAERSGVSLPLVRLWPGGEVLAIKAELALARFGLE